MSSNLARRGISLFPYSTLELEGGEWANGQDPAALPPEKKPVTYLQGMSKKAADIVTTALQRAKSFCVKYYLEIIHRAVS
jgi:hypothetical protein